MCEDDFFDKLSEDQIKILASVVNVVRSVFQEADVFVITNSNKGSPKLKLRIGTKGETKGGTKRQNKVVLTVSLNNGGNIYFGTDRSETQEIDAETKDFKHISATKSTPLSSIDEGVVIALGDFLKGFKSKTGSIIFKKLSGGSGITPSTLLRSLTPQPGKKYKKGKQIEAPGRKVWPRDQNVPKNAIKKADYKCEYDETHMTFDRTYNKGEEPTQFMEGHHLIPMQFQGDFEESIDCIKNVISLCPNCHAAIHKSDKKNEMIKYFHGKRIDDLKELGLDVDLTMLYQYYRDYTREFEEPVE